MFGPLPCSERGSMLWPVRWVKYSPNPRAVITARAASSISAPRTASPLATRVCTSAIAASRPSRTAVHTSRARDDGVPSDAIHV